MSRTSLVLVLLIGSGLGAQQPGSVDPDAPALVQPFAQLVGEAVESDGIETLLASIRIELGSGGVRRVQSRTVRSTGEIVGQVALRYRSTEEKK